VAAARRERLQRTRIVIGQVRSGATPDGRQHAARDHGGSRAAGNRRQVPLA